MAVIENSGLMKYKDKDGNTNIMYPITNTDNIDGLEELVNNYVKKHGDVMTGNLVVPGIETNGLRMFEPKPSEGVKIAIDFNPTEIMMTYRDDNNEAHAAIHITAAEIAFENDFNGALLGRIDGLALPKNDAEAVNKKYVDGSIQSAIQNTWEASY